MTDIVKNETVSADKKVIFSKAYKFEGEEISELDLSGIDNLSARQLCNVEKKFETSGNFSALKEMNLTYALFVAAEVSARPIEFFDQLRAKDALKIKNVVAQSFFE